MFALPWTSEAKCIPYVLVHIAASFARKLWCLWHFRLQRDHVQPTELVSILLLQRDLLLGLLGTSPAWAFWSLWSLRLLLLLLLLQLPLPLLLLLLPLFILIVL
jgi:hypothetical protein